MKYYYLKLIKWTGFKLIIKFLFLFLMVFSIYSSNLNIYQNSDIENLIVYNISFEDFILSKSTMKYISRNDVLKKYNEILKKQNSLMELYINNYTNTYLVDYFTKFTGNKKISLSILYYSYKYNINPELSFALAWNESRFVPSAINTNNNLTVDRGIFQLNSKTFTNLEHSDFFDSDINALHGLKYLAWCLKQGKNQRNALIIYNAGIGRLYTPPQSTLLYISRISDKQNYIKANALSFVKSMILKDNNLSD